MKQSVAKGIQDLAQLGGESDLLRIVKKIKIFPC